MRVLVTGATGKVGQAFLARFLNEDRWHDAHIVALCHNRTLPETDRLTVVRGSISDREVVAGAMAGITHVVHMAAVKEDPVHAMDVSVKGMFQLLEEFRQSESARQFMLIGGDCVVGHCFVKWNEPVTETSGWRPYPGVYALSKVLEEAMLEQYFTQYGINGVTLRAPWIMEKDDFRYVLSFGDDQFGGPSWDGMITPEQRQDYAARTCVPLLLDIDGKPLRRNFIHLDDLVEAMMAAFDNPAAHQQLFNISMTEPVDYGVVAEHLAAARGLEPVRIPSSLHSNILDNAKARHVLGWTPRIAARELVDRAFAYERAPDDVRKVWYVG